MQEMRELRIIGPPGCGKTTELSRRANQAAGHYGGEAVLICSLTRTAAAEVAGRDTLIPPQNIATLHACAFRALGLVDGMIAESPKRLPDWNDFCEEQGQPYFKRSLAPPGLDDAAVENGFGLGTEGDKCASEWQIARARQRPLESLSSFGQAYARLWGRWLKETGYVDYTGLLELALTETDAAPGGPAVIMADETQDLSRLGMSLLRHWGKNTRWLVTVGDPCQCLYHWAGTEPEAFITPAIDSEHQRVLAQSYRVPAAIHRYAREWIRPVMGEIEARWGQPIQYHPRDGEGSIRRLAHANWRFPEAAVHDAEQKLAEGKTVMFLTACSHMLEPVLARLRQEGVPFANPWRTKRGDWNPLAPRKGSSASGRLRAFLRSCPGVWGDACNFWSARDLWNWAEVCEAKGLIRHGAKKCIEEAARAAVGADRPLSAAELEEWLEAEAVLPALEASLEGNPEWWAERLPAAKKRSAEFPLAVYRKRGPEALRERPRVIVGTIHSLKGSEADVVYLFPDLSQNGMLEWLKPGTGRDGIIRAFYVALTRAREELVVCRPASARAVPIY